MTTKGHAMKIEFKGWDWVEIAPIFGIESGRDEDQLLEELQQKLDDLMMDVIDDKRNGAVQIRQLRKFACAISKNSISYDAPLFKGLCNIKDDATFLKWMAEILGHMWN
jgi:hypothetical protein